jgi:hypothetical protein
LEDVDLRHVAEHNQKSIEELVKNFSELCIYLNDGRTILISKKKIILNLKNLNSMFMTKILK